MRLHARRISSFAAAVVSLLPGCERSVGERGALSEGLSSKAAAPFHWQTVDGYVPPASIAPPHAGSATPPGSILNIQSPPASGNSALAAPQAGILPASLVEKTTPSAKETATQRNLIQPSDAIANAAETDGVAILNPPTHGEAQPPEEVKNSDFKPPFAERVNVFAPPGAGTASPSTDGAATASYSASDVTLKGFARVSELRAILMIDELITPLAVGEEKYGVRVVAVEPPQVTLARADQQWSLSLAPSSKQPANGDPARKGDREK